MDKLETARRIRAAKDRRKVIGDELKSLHTLTGERSMTPQNAARWEVLEGELDAVDAEIARLEDEHNRAGAGFGVSFSRSSAEYLEDAERAGGPDRSTSGEAYRSAALASVESWDRTTVPDVFRDNAVAALEAAGPKSKNGRLVAAHVAAFGTKGYADAFQTYLIHGRAGLNHDEIVAMRDAEERARFDRNDPEIVRALNEGSTSAGGAIVPPFLDPAIVLSNTGINNPFRAISRVIPFATQVWKGVTSAGVTAEWTAEAAEMTDASPSNLVQPSITPVRADASVQASWELLGDTGLGEELAMLFADAKDILEGTAFVSGTGSTQPFGVLNRLQSTTASRVAATTNGALGAVDVFAVSTALPARWQNNAAWICHRGIANVLRALATGPSQAQSAFWSDFGGPIPPKLTGYPLYLASAMQSALSAATASNDDVLILGDFRQFAIVDRIGMSVANAPVIGSNRRLTGETIFGAFWRTGSDVLVTDAFRLLRV